MYVSPQKGMRWMKKSNSEQKLKIPFLKPFWKWTFFVESTIPIKKKVTYRFLSLGVIHLKYCCWFRNPAITSWYGEYPIIYRVSAPSQLVVWDFSHQNIMTPNDSMTKVGGPSCWCRKRTYSMWFHIMWWHPYHLVASFITYNYMWDLIFFLWLRLLRLLTFGLVLKKSWGVVHLWKMWKVENKLAKCRRFTTVSALKSLKQHHLSPTLALWGIVVYTKSLILDQKCCDFW